jgi:hypothetical protein
MTEEDTRRSRRIPSPVIYRKYRSEEEFCFLFVLTDGFVVRARIEVRVQQFVLTREEGGC